MNIWLAVLIFEPIYFPSQVKTAAHKHVELSMTNILTANWCVSE